MFCIFCQKSVKNKNSKYQHEIRCKNNPNKIEVKSSMGMLGKKGSNQFIKASKLGLPKPIVSKETRKKISETSKKQVWTETRRKNLSESMKRAVEKYPESYSSSNRGRTKQIIYDGIKFQGQWELDFYKWTEKENLNAVRVTEGFPYIWNGERTYFPDFYIESLDLYVEIKGYETDRDKAKWKQFPKKLRVIKKKEINEIKKNCFGGL